MTEQHNAQLVDQTAIRFNQAAIISFLLLAFLLDSTALVVFVGAVMLLGTLQPRLALFQQFYRRLLRPRGLIRSDPVPDHPEPHRFAQGLGGTVVSLAFLALLAGYPLLGWALAWLVIGLSALNLFLGFCAGCFVYYQLNRLGVPGFRREPLTRG